MNNCKQIKPENCNQKKEECKDSSSCKPTKQEECKENCNTRKPCKP